MSVHAMPDSPLASISGINEYLSSCIASRYLLFKIKLLPDTIEYVGINIDRKKPDDTEHLAASRRLHHFDIFPFGLFFLFHFLQDGAFISVPAIIINSYFPFSWYLSVSCSD